MNTLLITFGIALVLGVVAYWKQIYPHRPMVMVGLVPAVLSLLLIPIPQAFWWLMGLDAVIVTVLVADMLSLPRWKQFSAERQTGSIASLRKSHQVTLTLSNQGLRDHTVWIKDETDEILDPQPDEFVAVLQARSRSTMHYQIRARRRGRFTLSKVYVRVRSRLGFWQRHLVYPVTTQVNVYPDMKQLSEYAILARTNRLSLMGLRRTRKIGQDNEFERLRDYTPDDNYKHIDWRTSARRRKLTVKDFQANQSQRIMFLVDCGRMMTNQSSGISLLDHALNAILMMSFVALRQGDQVGLLSFSDEIHHYIPPGGGRGQMNHLLHATYDQFPTLVESRYDEAFLYLGSHCRKRTLVVLVTNVIDEVNAHQIQQYMSNLVGRHLPLGVLLRDHQMFDAAEMPNPRGESLYRAAAAAEILTWRHQVLTDLESKGVLMLDSFPEQMTAPLVNRYLDIKARHLL